MVISIYSDIGNKRASTEQALQERLLVYKKKCKFNFRCRKKLFK